MSRRVLWWGRSDPLYPRNRLVRGAFRELGYEIVNHHPLFSALGDIEAFLRALKDAHLVWVPCFRQRDLAAALRYGRRHGLPVIADPLISAWDKQVFERNKFAPGSAFSTRLKHWESRLLGGCDLVIADTPAHASFFVDALGVRPERTRCIWVGAEAAMFNATPVPLTQPLEALFFGSFIGLHGIGTVVEAARLTQGKSIIWTLLGSGPERESAVRAGAGLAGLRFENPVPYATLPSRIAAAHVVLGVFGASEKAGRVIPNKVFQGLACGRPVVTRIGTGYPATCLIAGSGLRLIPPGDPAALARSVMSLAAEPELLHAEASRARALYASQFGTSIIRDQLSDALAAVGLT